MNRVDGKFCLVLSLIYSLIAGLYPFELSGGIALSDIEISSLEKIVSALVEQFGANDFLRNIAYFLPWGIISYLLLSSPHARASRTLLSAALVGGIVSLGIELAQIFFYRYPSVFDVIANTLGATLGALICILSPIDVRAIATRVLTGAQQSRLLLLIVFLFGAVPFITTVAKSRWFDFQNWDRSFTLQLANEATLDRPWLGTIYLAAVYNRGLAPQEVARLYEMDLSQNPTAERLNKNLIALYTFDEGHGAEVRDVSDYGPPLNLKLYPSSRFRWLKDGNGIEILRPAILKSNGPAEKLFDALKASNELSIEVWLMPSRRRQSGPARIVSFSRDTQARNFTLGQVGTDIDFRLRTPITGTNGTPVSLRSINGSVARQRSHLLVTYKEGVETLYVDGRKYSEDLDLKKSANLAFGTRKTPLARVAYVLVYFFPVSFFFSFVLSNRFRGFAGKFPAPAILAVSLLTITEGFQAYLFARTIDLPLLAYGVVIGIAGALAGATLAKVTQAAEKLSLVR